MQVCDSCGACREHEWKRCPFCRASLTATTAPSAEGSGHFDALAAEAEFTEAAVLPSPILDEDNGAETHDLITENDLAHLTGGSGPQAHGWDSQVPNAPTAPTADDDPGIDAPVSKAVIVPLVFAAAAVVLFAAYSIVTSSSTPRPDTVALIDRSTTTEAPVATTTVAETTVPERGPIGVELAEQASRLCAGAQFSIARAEAPSQATFNDLVTAVKDGRSDWETDPDHQTLRSAVPPLVGCLTTADAGEIDRCPANGFIVSRRSVDWSYRVLQTIDGTELGADSGTATDLRPCEELIAESGGEDSAFWSALPQDRIDLVAATYTSAPHPSSACTSDLAPIEALPVIDTPLTLDAAHESISDLDVELPDGWEPTDERSVGAVACLQLVPDGEEEVPDSATPVDGSTEPACSTSVLVTIILLDGTPLGSWVYSGSTCAEAGLPLAPPIEWWVDSVGPALGYAESADESPEESGGE